MDELASTAGGTPPRRPMVVLEEVQPVDIRGAFRDVLRHKWLVAAATLVCGVAGTAYAFLAPQWFRAEVVMIPVTQKSPLSTSSLGEIGGLASLAGLDLGGGGDQESMAALRSRAFAAEFIAARNLIPVLFADDWDPVHGKWNSSDPDKQPDMRKAVEYFDEKVRTVGEDKKSGVVTIAVQWKDRSLAADWANDLARLINARMRKRALEESERNVDYLQHEIAAANIVSLQQSIGRVLESELQKLMMARGSEEYAFKIIDPAVAPRKRYSPQRALVVIMSTIAGALLSIGFVLLRRKLEIDARQQRITP
jgi:uncharacterized protein involved in exopolysaccharide biosynthesis